ncbi:MAG: hypothetical protein HGA44_12245 [Cellulomonadaceae bacterium]|nr:hypothetical protein [Cellulomonadaceae bacterium]
MRSSEFKASIAARRAYDACHVVVPCSRPFGASGYVYADNRPTVLADPTGLTPNWGDVGTFGTSVADKLSMGFAPWARAQLGAGDFIDVCSDAYTTRWAEATAIALEIVTLRPVSAVRSLAVRAPAAAESAAGLAQLSARTALSAALGAGARSADELLAANAGNQIAANAGSQIAANQAAGNAARDLLAAAHPNSLIEQSLQTTAGVRRVDVLTQELVAIESKVGRTSLTAATQAQLTKDALLLENGDVAAVEWVFSRSAVTGKVGPTGPLAEALDSAGIPWRLAP